MREFMILVENIVAPQWFVSGTPVDIYDDRWDMLDFLEDDEFDREWRLCLVPNMVVARHFGHLKPVATSDQTENQRMAQIQGWALGEGGLGQALMKRPPIVIMDDQMNVLDGSHRIILALQASLPRIPMIVGIG